MTVPRKAESDDTETDRSGWQYATPVLMLVAYVLGPWVLIPAFGAEKALVPVLIFLFGTAALAGFVDGWTYRTTFSLPFFAGVGFWLAKALYFNDGTFLYALGCAATAAIGMFAGQAIGTKFNHADANTVSQARG